MKRAFIFAIFALFAAILPTTSTGALKYGSGAYGKCQYNTCNISLSSSGSVAANITPNGTATTCSVASDSVIVTTGATTGFTLSISDADTTNALAGTNGNSIASTSGTSASPIALTANRWGYRVDGTGGFGAGPTSVSTNVAIPSLTFAAVPLSSAGANTLASTTAAASAGITTPVWYGVCTDTSTPNGSYSDGVVYTAVTN